MKLTLGEKLKDERTRRGMTASQVCKELEEKYDCPISMGTYNDIENDKDKNFGYKYFIGLSQLFGVSIDYLLGVSEVKTLTKDIENVKIINKFTGLSEEAIITLKNNIDKKKYHEILNRLISNNSLEIIANKLLAIRENSEKYIDLYNKYKEMSVNDYIVKMQSDKNVLLNDMSILESLKMECLVERYTFIKFMEKIADIYDLRTDKEDSDNVQHNPKNE